MFEIIFSAPYILKAVISLLFIIFLNKITGKLFIAVLAGAILLGIWSGRSPAELATLAGSQIISAPGFMLVIVLLLVTWFSAQMSETGQMQNLVNIVQKSVSRRAGMAILPAIIGFLPMPGGAIFSAPLVDDFDQNKSLDPMLKTRINYWFRHIWEYWWPFYPGVILAMALSSLSFTGFILLQLPVTLISICAGYFFLLRRLPDCAESVREPVNLLKFLDCLWPIILVFLIYIPVKILQPENSGQNMMNSFLSSQYLPVSAGIFFSVILLQIAKPLDKNKWQKIIFSSNTLSFALIVICLRIYGACIDQPLGDGSLIMKKMGAELSAAGIPLIPVIIALPWLAGLTTGVAFGMVGASFPVVIGLLGENPDPNIHLAAVTLAYTSGYIGMMLSPVHVCLVVTNQYFKTSTAATIQKSLIQGLTIFIFTGIYAFLIFRLWK